MALDKDDIDKLAAALREGGGGNSKPSSGVDMGNVFSQLKTGLGDLAGSTVPLIAGFNRLATGASGASTVLEGIGKLSGMIPGLGGFGSAVQEAGNSLLKNKSQMDEAGKIGVGGNDLGKFNRMAAESGQKVGEFTDTIVNMKGGLNGLAGSAQRSAETFSKLSGEIQQGAAGAQLRQLGIDSNELANITALSVLNSKKLNLDDAETRAKAKASANELALQLAETALTTGMSREAIAKSIQVEEQKPKVMLAMLQMDEQQRQNFTKTQAQLAALGPTTQALASEIVTGGVRTKEGIAAMTALGPAGEELARAIKQQQGARTEEEKKAAAAAVENATAKVNERMASKEYAQIANTATGQTAETMAKMAGENKSLLGSVAAAQENAGDIRKGQAAQKAESQARIAGIAVDDKGKATGQDDPGTRLSRTINEFDRLTNIQAAGLARNLEGFNNKLGASPAAIEKFNDALRIGGGATSTRGPATTYNEAEAQQADTLNKAKDKIAEASRQLTSGAATQSDELKKRNYVPGQKLDSRDGGTLEKTGSAVEPQDAIVKIHKGETVLSPEATANAGKQLSTASKAGSASQTITETLEPATSPNESKSKAADTGPLEATLSEYQKTVLKYAATEGEMKQVQLDNEKNIIRGAEINILENKKRIADIEKEADGRELTRREQGRIERIQSEIQGQEESLSRHKEALAVYENIDALSNQTVVEAKKTASEETMASLRDQEAAGYAANRAAAAARDALEEKAEAEGRSMTEAEEAQYKLLGVELNASSNKITSAQEAQKALERSEQEKAFQAKVQQQRDEMAKESAIQATEIAKVNADEQANIQEEGNTRSLENANETIRINGKLVDPNSPEGQSVKAQMAKQTQEIISAGLPVSSKIEEAKAQMAKTLGGIIPDTSKLQEKISNAAKVSQEAMPKADQTGFVTEQKKQLEGMFANIGGGGGILGDMFNPKIIDKQLAEANKTKIPEVKKEEPKPAPPAPKPAEKPAEPKPVNTEIGIKDLNDQLKMLNMNMLKLISHSETTSAASEKTAKNSAKATGNRYA